MTVQMLTRSPWSSLTASVGERRRYTGTRGVSVVNCVNIRGAMKLLIYNFMKNYILNFTAARLIFIPRPSTPRRSSYDG